MFSQVLDVDGIVLCYYSDTVMYLSITNPTNIISMRKSVYLLHEYT